MDEAWIRSALGAWGVRCGAIRGDVLSAGSPERSLGRWVVEGADGALFLLERIDARTASRKVEMAKLMAALADGGLPVSPPLKSKSGETLVPDGGGLWQLTRFVQGVPLSQPDYTRDAWRGEVLAGFLLTMRRISEGLEASLLGEPFDLPAYIDTLTRTLTERKPKVAEALSEATAFLKDRLYPHWNTLPVALAHGDIHGINVLWSDHGIASVIDWEFFGQKPRLYDVANMVGCCGIESPDGLLHGLAPALIRNLNQTHFADPPSWDLLPECVMALRYAWLSEWLRKDDAEMINLELSYIYLLMDNRDKLATAWS